MSLTLKLIVALLWLISSEMALWFAWDSCRCMWTCFPVASVYKQHTCVCSESAQGELQLSHLCCGCQGRGIHIQLLTAMCYARLCVIPQPAMVPGSTWIQQDFLCSLPFCHHLAPSSLNKSKQKKPPPNPQPCNMFALSYWHCCVLCINCRFDLTF